MAGVLEGVKVLELTTMITGPLAGMMLGDLGAEIIKVENPGGGDMFRTFRGGNYSPYFCAYNRNKRSITLDLRSDQGSLVVHELVKEADILIENYRPGVMDRLGLGEDKLKELNPGLINCSISGFGKDGPYMKRPAYDAVAQAVTGISSLFVDPDDPQLTGPTISDNMTGIYACYGILGALYKREKTGKGSTVEVNMVDSSLAFVSDPFLLYKQLGITPGPLMRVRASQSYAMKCADGKLLAIHMSSPQKFWEGVQVAFDRSEWGNDPRFKEREGRIDNYTELASEFRKVAITKPRAHWMKGLQENDVPHAPLNSVDEVFDDPQVKHLDTFVSIEHPRQGSFTGIRRPVWFDGTRQDQPLNPPPELNEHGAEILAELGYDIDDMKECGAVAPDAGPEATSEVGA
jgi:crotonobetainyl-CoA:carnitine CoA-transferase CaiB-like acyl-CoA transferase